MATASEGYLFARQVHAHAASGTRKNEPTTPKQSLWLRRLYKATWVGEIPLGGMKTDLAILPRPYPKSY